MAKNKDVAKIEPSKDLDRVWRAAKVLEEAIKNYQDAYEALYARWDKAETEEEKHEAYKELILAGGFAGGLFTPTGEVGFTATVGHNLYCGYVIKELTEGKKHPLAGILGGASRI